MPVSTGNETASQGQTPTADVVLLDLGNILFHVRFDAALACWGAAADIPAEDLAQRFRMDEAYAAHETGALGWSAYRAHLTRVLRIELTDADWRHGWQAVIGDGVAGIDARLARLASRRPTYAFSNTNFVHLESMRHRHGDVLGHFEQVFTSCEIGARKPTRRAFAAVVARLGVAPERVLFVDDTHANVLGAREAGLQAVHAPEPEQVRSTLDRLLAE